MKCTRERGFRASGAVLPMHFNEERQNVPVDMIERVVHAHFAVPDMTTTPLIAASMLSISLVTTTGIVMMKTQGQLLRNSRYRRLHN